MTRIIALMLALAPVSAVAGPAWEMFEARCLDAYEHLTEPVIDGLTAGSDTGVLTYVAEDGLQLILDPAPDDGNRACSVVEPGAAALDAAYLEWVDTVTSRQMYVPDGGMLVSEEWVEPQVHVEAFMGPDGATYRVLETELES